LRVESGEGRKWWIGNRKWEWGIGKGKGDLGMEKCGVIVL
jgi:hypothetical protein